ncbi:amidohydrolase [Sinosporangium siamense]|uniref:Amidohydrolase n=1 Tax=Sinosporangium siamense TaxID=1367973 RepID=A0A919RP72_9ACTN|nr:amidohydrolase [Sinosporangium siamense]GII96485.1 amidohydrolase [Sinosporangium siamense]
MSSAPAADNEATVVQASIRTMDPQMPRAGAMLVRDGRVAAIGDVEEVEAAAGTGARRLDLRGATVVPGLIDSHNHMLWVAMQDQLLDLAGCRSISEVQQRIRVHAERNPDGWIVSSEGWFIEDLAEARHPTRGELDAAVADRPIYLPRIAHAAVANSEALRIAGIDTDHPDVAGGRIVRDPDSGRPTGELLEAPAFELVARHVPAVSVRQREAALRAVQARYHAAGVTGVVDPCLTADDMAIYRALHERGELTVRTVMMPVVEPHLPDDDLDAWLSALPGPTGQGDEWLRTGGVKVFLDGIASMGTALLREPYPGEGHGCGTQVVPAERLRAIAAACARRGWSVGVHTVGGGAIDLALAVFAEVDSAQAPIAGLRFSLIHAYLWPSEQNIATAARLGVCVAVQPPMQTWVAPKLVARWGVDGAARATPLRAWLDGGVRIGGGSDAPLTPTDPLAGIWQAVTRQVAGHGVLGPEQCLTAEEALALYTTGAAHLSFADHERGVLRVGMAADWVALDTDPVAAPHDLRSAQVLKTCVGGLIVHDNL